MSNKELRKITQEIREIKAALSKSADDPSFPSNGKVEVAIQDYYGKILFEEEMTEKEILNHAAVLESAYDLFENEGYLEKVESLEKNIKELQERASRLKKSLDKVKDKASGTLSDLKKMGLLEHYMKGGDGHNTITFEDTEGVKFTAYEGKIREL